MEEARKGSRLETICGALAIVVPLGLSLLTAAPAPTWLDSGEFLAVGYALGSAHPPGHPVFVTLVKLLSLIPLGSLAFRGTLASAIPGAFSCFFLFKLLVVISRSVDREAPRWLTTGFALVGALLFGSSPTLWIQSTRPEVYALQLALVLSSLLALVSYSIGDDDRRDGRFLAAAGLSFGLSLANHHFLSLLIIPGIIVMLTADALKSWRRTVKLACLGALPAIVVGLVPYAHLPLRSSRTPGAVSLGESPDITTFFWVLSAKAFQKAVTDPPTNSFAERYIDAGLLLVSQLGPLTIVVAAGGLYFLCRQRWGPGFLLVLSLLATWIARAWMGFDPTNPDILGYLLIAVCVFCLGAARVGPLLVTIVPGRLTVRIGAATVLALALLGWNATTAAMQWEQLDLSSSRSAEIVAGDQLHRLPPRSVIITELFGSGFNLWSAQTIEGMRPDVSHFHFPFVGFPSYVRQVHDTHRDLQGILRAALARGQLDERELSTLAQRRPVFIEPLLQTPHNIQPFLLPRGLLWEAAAEPLSLTDVRLAVPDHFARWDELFALLGEDVRDEQTMRVLLWRLYIDALLFAQRGEREAAQESVQRSLSLAPGASELVRLEQALDEGEGPLDVTPFLPHAARGRDEHPEETEEATSTRPRVLDF